MLGHTDERHLVLLECLHQPCKVEQRTAESVDTMSQHTIDLPSLDIGRESLECRAVEIAAAIATVVVAGSKRSPTSMGLAVDVCFGGFPLGIERIEILIESFLGA